MNRGDIVVIDLPNSDGSPGKVRPALVVQNDSDNARLRDSIVALITGNITRVNEPTQTLVDPNTPEGQSSGLHGPSAVLCGHVYTIRQSRAIDTIGSLSDSLMGEIDECLKQAFALTDSSEG